MTESPENAGGWPASVAEETERLRAALEEQRQQTARLLADFDNHRRRVERESGQAQKEGRRDAVQPLLPAIDTLERALAAGSTDPSFYEGVAATYRQFLTALAEIGAVPIESVGHAFDPNLHEIVATHPATDVEPGTVVREVRRGWRLGEELIRPAQVVVAAADGGARSWR